MQILNDPLKELPKRERIAKIKRTFKEEGWYIKNIFKKDRLKILKIFAKTRGGECLSTRYANYSTKIKWMCAEGHMWKQKPGNIIYSGAWCPKCHGNAPHNIKYLYDEFKKRNILLLSEKYKGMNAQYLVKCQICNHKWKPTANRVINKRNGCPKCYGNAPHNIEYLRKGFRKHHMELLDEEYKNMLAKYSVKCLVCGYEWNVEASSVINKGTKCPKCVGHMPLTIDSLRNRFSEHNINLLEYKYKGTNAKYNVMCLVCKYEWNVEANSVINKGTGCPKCAGRIPYNIKSLSKAFKEHNMEILDDRYKGTRTKYNVKCLVCGNEWGAWISSVINKGYGCPNCRNKTENTTRMMIELITKHKFPRYSPQKLKKSGICIINTNGNQMHFDGYCPQIIISDQFPNGMAFEYHGRQHTDGDSYIYKEEGGSEAFERRKKDDRLKRGQCEEQGILLIEIWGNDDVVYPNFSVIYDELVRVLKENGIETNKKNISNGEWRKILSSLKMANITPKLQTHLW